MTRVVLHNFGWRNTGITRVDQCHRGDSSTFVAVARSRAMLWRQNDESKGELVVLKSIREKYRSILCGGGEGVGLGFGVWEG